jgi:cytochrome c oxidase subunit IV
VGFYTAIFTTIITLVTFGFAILAVPISGANCVEGCIQYPYLDTVAQFPKDYRWMPLAMILVLSYLVLMVSIHACASQDRKIFSQIGLSFAVLAALILLVDYFVQFSVVPISLMSGETEGITLLTQYNPHGIFIALEELGYILMSLSFLFVAPVFADKTRLESSVRWVFLIAFLLAVAALVVTSINHGLDRQDSFEIAVISIDWLVLVINGILLSIVFRRELKETATQP